MTMMTMKTMAKTPTKMLTKNDDDKDDDSNENSYLNDDDKNDNKNDDNMRDNENEDYEKVTHRGPVIFILSWTQTSQQTRDLDFPLQVALVPV